MASVKGSGKSNGTSIPRKTPPPAQLPPFAPGGVKVASPSTGMPSKIGKTL